MILVDHFSKHICALIIYTCPTGHQDQMENDIYILFLMSGWVLPVQGRRCAV